MKKVIICLLLIPLEAHEQKAVKVSVERFVPLLEAVVMVESNGNLFAYNAKENAVGLLQVRQPALDDVNRRFGTGYSLEEMYNPLKAADVFIKYLSMYGHDVRIWNGGPRGVSKLSTQGYAKKVEAYYRKVSDKYVTINTN